MSRNEVVWFLFDAFAVASGPFGVVMRRQVGGRGWG